MIIKFDPRKTKKKSVTDFFYRNTLVWFVFTSLLCFLQVLYIDRAASLFFSKPQPLITSLATSIIEALNPVEILIAIPLFYLASLLIWKKPTLAIPCKMLIFLLPLTMIAIKLLHMLVPRTPPSLFLEKNIFTISWNSALTSISSFPSQQAAIIGTFSGLLAFLKPIKSTKYLLLALCFGMCDAIVCKSFVSDVFVGVILGFSISLYTCKIWKDKKITL